MKRQWLLYPVIAIMACYNAPTPPSKIGGAHVSSFHYENRDCESLLSEIKFLEKREKELVKAQEERIKKSENQQRWAEGIGIGDGIEASELHRVRGEIKAARGVFENKECTIR